MRVEFFFRPTVIALCKDNVAAASNNAAKIIHQAADVFDISQDADTSNSIERIIFEWERQVL